MARVKRITLKELHEKTGSLVRESATSGYAVVVTDRGRPVATILPYQEQHERRRFSERVLRPDFTRLVLGHAVAGSSTETVSADRDER
jgi:prevent-host-death family protein